MIVAAAGGVVLDAEQPRGCSSARASRSCGCGADPAILVDAWPSGDHRPLLDDDPAGVLRAAGRRRASRSYREVADVGRRRRRTAIGRRGRRSAVADAWSAA